MEKILNFTTTKLPKKPITSEKISKNGITKTTANVIGAVKNLRGLIDSVFKALIWSLVFIVEISAASDDASLPAIMSPVITGPSSLTIESAITFESELTDAKSPSPEYVCKVKTAPVKNEVKNTTGRE